MSRPTCDLCGTAFKNPTRLAKHRQDKHGIPAPAIVQPKPAGIAPAEPGIVHAYTDGGCHPNPGPGGWGVVLLWGAVERELCGGALETTNNRMEMTAAIEALKAITRSVQVLIHTDSKYLRDGITKWIAGWKRNGWRTAARTPVKNEDLWRELDRLCGQHTVTWKWVKGHAGNAGNERADKLATRGRKEAIAHQRNNAAGTRPAAQDLEAAHA